MLNSVEWSRCTAKRPRIGMLLGAVVFMTVTVQCQGRAMARMADDWSAFFPEFPKCERTVKPISMSDGVIEQSAVYDWIGHGDRNDPNYFGCGSVTLRLEPDALQRMRARDDILFFPTTQRLRIAGFDALRNSPLCGNDPWLGTISVYFDKDKFLTVSASVGAFEILDLAETADYRSMKLSMNRIRRSRIGWKSR